MDKRNNTVDRIIDINGLAEILSIKKGTIYSHLSRGNDLPPYFWVGSQTRWRESVVWQWIEKKEKERKRKKFEE